MMALDQVQIRLIRILADGHFHSGAELGSCLGMSRPAISQRVKKMEKMGLTVHAVKGRGYRLVEPLSLLDSNVVREQMQSEALALMAGFRTCLITKSTNIDVMSLNGRSGYQVLASEHQTEGRGRRGRGWQQRFGSSVTFSVMKSYALSLSQVSQLSLWSAVAVAEYLSSAFDDDIWIKWPNDIYVRNKKLAGILLEAQTEPDGFVKLVIGIGINGSRILLNDQGIDQPWVSLSDLRPRPSGGELSRNEIMAGLLSQLLPALEIAAQPDSSGLQERWQKYDRLAGHKVRVTGFHGEQEGICKGISESGELLLDLNGELHKLNSGEVSVRLSDG